MDIDRQAVEVTKLSLLLKVLEGESDESLGEQLPLFSERVLPNLDRNIKCGNSLIGPDYFAGQLMPDEDSLRRINAFDWASEFPDVMRAGGFDCIIGNPPYIRIQTMKEWAPLEVEIYKQLYQSAGAGNYDIYVVFVEKGLSLLNPQGRLGFILPHKFFNAKYGEPVRALISTGKHLSHAVHFGDQQVFKGATTYTSLIFLDKAGSDACRFVKVDDLDKWREAQTAPSAIAEAGDDHTGGRPSAPTEGPIASDAITAMEWNFSVGAGSAVLEKLSKMPVKLGLIAHIFVGTQTSADDVYVLSDCQVQGRFVSGYSKSLGQQVKIESACTVPFLHGKEIRRYEPPESNSRLICPYEISNDSFSLLTTQKLSQKYPFAFAYLTSNKAKLTSREKGRFKGDNWYAFGYPKSMTLFQRSKIIVPDYNNVASFTYDTNSYYYKTGYGVIIKEKDISSYYVLGLLNSPLLFMYLSSVSTTLRGGYVRFWTQFIEQLPVRTIDFNDPADKARHDQMVTLVQQMLELHKRLQAAHGDQDRQLYQRQIDATDKQIDALVYELYELSEDEVKIVEESSR